MLICSIFNFCQHYILEIFNMFLAFTNASIFLFFVLSYELEKDTFLTME